MRIIPGPASKELGEKIASLSKAEVVPIASKVFPDGESYVRLEGKVQDEDVAIVQSTGPPQNTNLLQLALLADAAKRNGAKKITAVVPYLAYARQDRAFLSGEALSIDVIANILKVSGISSLLAVNVHQQKVLDHFPFLARNVSAAPLLADYFLRKGIKGAFVLAPDEGAAYMLEDAERILGGGSGHLEKQRDRYTGQISTDKRSLDVKNKNVIILDDLISTGGTIIKAAGIVKELGATGIYAACAHALLIGDAEKRILGAGIREIVGTDSITSSTSKVSVAPLISTILAEGP